MSEKTYDELEFTDDFLFCNILMANEDLCIELVEMITGRKIKSIVKSEDQKSIRLTYDGKGVRLDVYFEDEDSVIYDIEMQTTQKYNLRKRSRYYQGMIDLNILSKGAAYNKLKETYIIFICTFDEFEDGRHIYSFESICRENPEIGLNDGTHNIFLCAGGDKDDCSEKMKDFLDYIAGRETHGKLSDRLRDEVIKSRKHEQWRLSYMLLEEKYKEKFDEGLKLGIEKGHAEERQNTERESKRADDAETELGKAIAEIDILRTELETLKKAML